MAQQQKSTRSGNKHRSSGNRSSSNRNARGRNNRRRRSGQGRSKKNINLDPIFRKYTNLVEEMIQSRKRYFEQFYRADPKKKEKLENIYMKKVEELESFRDTLKQEDLDKLDKMFPKHELDTTYSNNHGLSPEESEVLISEIVDPHFLETQKSANYSNDTEESTGTLDDYKAYKGLS